MSVLLVGWADTNFGELVQLQKGRKPAGLGPRSDSRTVAYINIAAFETQVIAEYAPAQDVPVCEPEDTLLVWDGARAGLAGWGASGFIGSTLSRLRSAAVIPGYLYYFISSQFGVLNSQTKGVGIPHIDPVVLAALKFQLPPLAEQTRIVEKIEELLTDLDAGVAELKAAQKKLAQYRQSLLKAAVDGSLTAEWRDQNTPTETGAQLLTRILQERCARWEAKQRAKFKDQGKPPPKDWQKKYPEPVQPDTSDLPELPTGWVWASLDMLGEIASGVAKGTKRNEKIAVHEVPYLRVANVQRGFLDLSEVKTIFATPQDISDLVLQDGDVLFNEGGDRDKLGRGWVWREEVTNCIHQNHVYRMRPALPEVLPELVSHHGNTFGKSWFKNVGKQTTNLASINMTMLRAFPVPLGPEAEQREIRAQLNSQLVGLDQQQQAVELAFKQTAAQRQNILRTAFSGQLVPQDPNDEPASVLLARISSDQAGGVVKKRRGAKVWEAA